MNELLDMMIRPLVACVLMTAVLSYLGLHVLRREVIFIDIAVAQVAALGAVIAHVSFHVHGDVPWLAVACALGATLVAALFFAVVKHRVSQLPIEATIGITYAIVAAGTLFIIGKSTGGHVHIRDMLAGSLLFVGWRSIGWTAAAFAGAGACLWLFHGSFESISDDYDRASRGGVSVISWDFLFYALCGVVITAAVHLAGVVVVFCFLIIPATISAFFSGRWGVRLLIAWGVGLVASISGLCFCHYMDFSAGVSVALVLGLRLIVLSGAQLAVALVLRRSMRAAGEQKATL
jgi:zinc/manganese transport system permease protein